MLLIPRQCPPSDPRKGCNASTSQQGETKHSVSFLRVSAPQVRTVSLSVRTLVGGAGKSRDWISLCIPDYSGTHYIDQGGLKLSEPPAFVITGVWNHALPSPATHHCLRIESQVQTQDLESAPGSSCIAGLKHLRVLPSQFPPGGLTRDLSSTRARKTGSRCKVLTKAVRKDCKAMSCCP